MTENEVRMLEEALAKLIVHERKAMRYEFDRKLADLRQQISAAATEITALRKDLAEARSAAGDAADVSLDNVSFLHRGRR